MPEPLSAMSAMPSDAVAPEVWRGTDEDVMSWAAEVDVAWWWARGVLDSVSTARDVRWWARERALVVEDRRRGVVEVHRAPSGFEGFAEDT
jgi:hypothetical protein